MRRLTFSLTFLPFIVFGQVTSPSLIASSGDSYSNSNVHMQFSIGEVVIDTYQNNAILTQGFHQGVLKIQTGVSELDLVTKVYPNPTTNIVIAKTNEEILSQ